MLMKLAFRNLTRNLRRSIITLAAIAVGLSVLILGLTLRTGQYEQMINSGVSQLKSCCCTAPQFSRGERT